MSRPKSVRKEKMKPVGFNLTVGTKEQLYKVAAFLHSKRTEAIKRMLDILFDQLLNDKNFKATCDAWDKAQHYLDDESSYTSFYVPEDYVKRFEEMMYHFGFIDRSPFLRLLIDYIYNHKVVPVQGEVIEKLQKDLENNGYKVLHIAPILNGNIYAFIENPNKKSPSGKPRTK